MSVTYLQTYRANTRGPSGPKNQSSLIASIDHFWSCSHKESHKDLSLIFHLYGTRKVEGIKSPFTLYSGLQTAYFRLRLANNKGDMEAVLLHNTNKNLMQVKSKYTYRLQTATAFHFNKL